jgi:hypothetical protein
LNPCLTWLQIVAFVVTTAMGSPQGSHAHSPRASFSLSITAKEHKVQAGSGVRVKLIMKNTSAREINLDFEPYKGFFDCYFQVFDQAGLPVPPTKYSHYACLEAGFLPWSTTCCPGISLAPGQSVEPELHLTRLFDLTRPGKYSILAAQVDMETHSIVKSNTVSITVIGPAPPPAPFSLAISVKEHTVKAGSEVPMQIVLTNTSADQIAIRGGEPPDAGKRDGYILDVRNAAGEFVPNTAYLNFQPFKAYLFLPGEANFFDRSFHGLKPGETLTNEVILDKLFDLSQPGKYTIQARRADENSKAVAKSNIIKVTVKKSASSEMPGSQVKR